MICTLLLVSEYHHALCSSLDYGSDAVEVESSAHEEKETGMRVKRFIDDYPEDMMPETSDDQSYLDYGDAYNYGTYSDENNETKSEERASEVSETFDFSENRKPLETTTVSDVTNPSLSTPSLMPLFTKDPSAKGKFSSVVPTPLFTKITSASDSFSTVSPTPLLTKKSTASDPLSSPSLKPLFTKKTTASGQFSSPSLTPLLAKQPTVKGKFGSPSSKLFTKEPLTNHKSYNSFSCI